MRPTMIPAAALAAMLACVAAPATAQVLYWIDTNHGSPAIHRTDADGLALTTLALPVGSLPEGLAVDAAGRVYWGEAAWTDAKILTAGGLLTSPATVVGGGSVIRGVAVDAVAQQVYWTTSNLVTGATLQRAPTTGGTAVTVLAMGAGANPRGLAVDPVGGRIYWADFDRDVLYRANLDGTDLAEWITFPDGTGPYGVAFDPTMQHVFWTEYNTSQVRSATLFAGGITTRASGLFQPTQLALDPSSLRYYVIESGVGQQAIRRGGMYSGGGPTLLATAVTTYGGLAFASGATVSVSEPAAALPADFALGSPQPNPVVGSVRFEFALPREASLRLAVFDVRGREVAVLARGTRPAGVHHASWSPRASADALPAGIYFARLVADGRSWSRRVVFVR